MAFTADLIEQLRELARRIRNLELSVYVYGRQPDTTPSDLTIANPTAAVTYYTEPVSLLPRASVLWSWQTPTRQDDPVASFFVSITKSTDPTTGAFGNVGLVNTLTTDNLSVNTNVTFRIYAVTKKGVIGPTTSVTQVITKSTTVPPQPSTPTGAAAIKGVRVTNDGKDNTGTAMPSNFAYYEVHKLDNGTETFTPTTDTLYTRVGLGESVFIPANNSYQNIAVRLIAVNTSDLKSNPSTGLVLTPTKVTDTDSGITLPSGSAFSDVNNLIKDGSFEAASFRTARTVPASFAYNNAAGAAKHGTWFLKHTNTTGSGTERIYYVNNGGVSETLTGEIIVSPGTKYYLAFQVRNLGSNGSVTLNVRFRANDNSYTYTGTTATNTDIASGDWELVQSIITIPDNTVSVMLYITVNSNNTVGEWHFDSLEMREVIGTTLIEDGAITTAKIGDASITTAKIVELDAAVIKSGEFSSDRIGSQTIATRHLRAGAVTQAELDTTVGQSIDIAANPALADMASASVVGGIADTVQNIANDVSALNNVVDISAAGVTISQDGSPFSINLNNSELGFYEGGARVAYVNGQKLYVRSAEFAEQVKIGVHIIEKYDADNTFIRWVG